MWKFHATCRLFGIALTLLLLSMINLRAETRSAHKYWDGKPAKSLASGGQCSKADQEAIFQQYGNPELMAMGDSLYNGTQSMRNNWWLSEWSVPSLIAIRMGLIVEHYGDRTGERTFFGPQYPTHGNPVDTTSNFGFNLETSAGGGWYVTRAFHLARIPIQQQRLLRTLITDSPPNGRYAVDNIAFAGANSADILHFTAGDFRRAAQKSLPETTWGEMEALGRSFFFSNAVFVLNPMKHPCLERMTPIQQVEFRRPKRLLVNVGANNGMWSVAFAGQSLSSSSCGENEIRSSKGQRRCDGTLRNFMSTKYLADMSEIVGRLRAVEGLEYVYVNGLARPSQTANIILAPGGDTTIAQTFLLDASMSAKSLQQADALVDDVNQKLKKLLDAASVDSKTKFAFVDVASMLEKYDYKRCLAFSLDKAACSTKRLKLDHKEFSLGPLVVQTAYLDNRPMTSRGEDGVRSAKMFIPKLTAGGLFSFDNMHLSSVGYEIMALAVREAMQAAGDKGLPPIPKEDRCKKKGQDGYQNIRPGDCALLVVEPGWSYADIGRREFMLQRIAGERMTKNRDYLNSIITFFNSAMK